MLEEKWIAAEKRSKFAGKPNVVNQGYDEGQPVKIFEVRAAGGSRYKAGRSELFGMYRGVSYSLSIYEKSLNGFALMKQMLGKEFVLRTIDKDGKTTDYTYRATTLKGRHCDKTGQAKRVWYCSSSKTLYFPRLANIRKPR
jgi:hypothetical protein